MKRFRFDQGEVGDENHRDRDEHDQAVHDYFRDMVSRARLLLFYSHPLEETKSENEADLKLEECLKKQAEDDVDIRLVGKPETDLCIGELLTTSLSTSPSHWMMPADCSLPAALTAKQSDEQREDHLEEDEGVEQND